MKDLIFKLSNNCDLEFDERGTFSLSAMFSVAGGVVFLLLFVNLARYVTTVNAVESTARKIARCISATDSECIATSLETTNAPLNWYGVSTSTNKTIYVPLFNYEASMTEQEWEARYTTYQLHFESPTLQYATSTLPLATFRRDLNRYFDEFGSLSLPVGSEINVYAPVFEPPFPENFLDGDYWGLARVNPEQQLAAQTAGGNPQPFRTANAVEGWQILPYEQNVVFHSPRISVPALPQNSECYNSSGTECSVATAAGGTPSPNEWREFAYIAFIPMGHVINNSGESTRLRWGYGSDLDSMGFVLNTYNPDGSLFRTYCLGGRIASNLPEGEFWFNDYIKGSSGASDGSTTRCDSNDFSKLQVPRGGSFSMVGQLRRLAFHADLNSIRAEVLFLYWFDEYQLVRKTVTHENTASCYVQFSYPNNRFLCESIQPSRDCTGLHSGQAIDLEYCGNTALAQAGYTKTSVTPRCSPGSDSFYLLDWMRKQHFVETKPLALCSNNSSPTSTQAEIELPKDIFGNHSIACGNWQEHQTSSRTGDLAIESSRCSLASSTKASSFQCTNKFLYGTSPEQSVTNADCEGVDDSLKQLQAEVTQLNSLLTQGVPPFPLPDTSIFTVDSNKDAGWEFAWTLEDYPNLTRSMIKACVSDLSLLADEPACKIENRIVNSAPIYETKESSGVLPFSNPSNVFNFSYPENAVSPPTGFFTSAVLYIQTGREWDKAITSVFPFSGDSVPQLPYFGQSGNYNYADYDLDCSLESYCNSSYTPFDSLEDVLRFHAAKEIPEASQKHLNFLYSVEPTGIARYDSEADYKKTAPQSCTPAVTVCRSEFNSEYLATLGSRDAPFGPKSCSDGTYAYCYNETETGQVFVPNKIDTKTNISLAQQIGVSEISRFLPMANGLCGSESEVSCTTISIETDASLLGNVHVTHRMPLTFPLDIILNSNSLSVQFTKSELQELRVFSKAENK